MNRRRKVAVPARAPLTRERVLRAAMELADQDGIQSLSMRTLGQRVGVEAMSLYKHVRNKEDILEGLVEMVFAEMLVIPAGMAWREAMLARAASARAVILRHPWSAMLMESRITPGPNRLRHHEAIIRALRGGGFSMPLTYAAFMTLDSYIYGFVMQEVAWPFEPRDRPQLVAEMAPRFSPEQHAGLLEMMSYALRRDTAGREGAWPDEDFAFGLGLILDSLERARESGAEPGR